MKYFNYTQTNMVVLYKATVYTNIFHLKYIYRTWTMVGLCPTDAVMHKIDTAPPFRLKEDRQSIFINDMIAKV